MEMGMATAMTRVLRKVLKKRKRIKMARDAPSRALLVTVSMDIRM